MTEAILISMETGTLIRTCWGWVPQVVFVEVRDELALCALELEQLDKAWKAQAED